LFRNVGIAARLDRLEAVSLAVEIAKYLRERGLNPVFESQLASQVKEAGESLDKMAVDLIVVVGGDGTILRTVHGMRRKAPVFAVRMGMIGFLADVDPNGALPSLERILEGRCVRDDCIMLSNNVGLPDALNEVRVGTETPEQMVEVEVLIDGTRIARDRVDAVLVATPTGSSGYALSAGANIVDPRLKAIVIAPICPLSQNFKPYVAPSNVEVTIKPVREDEVVILVDSQFRKKVLPAEGVKVKKSKKKITFLRTGENFYERLTRRLGRSCLSP
jgi:NAD+ kinase